MTICEANQWPTQLFWDQIKQAVDYERKVSKVARLLDDDEIIDCVLDSWLANAFPAGTA